MRKKACSPCDPSLSLSLSLWPLHSSVETKVSLISSLLLSSLWSCHVTVSHAYKYIACFQFYWKKKKSFLLYITKTFHLLYILIRLMLNNWFACYTHFAIMAVVTMKRISRLPKKIHRSVNQRETNLWFFKRNAKKKARIKSRCIYIYIYIYMYICKKESTLCQDRKRER